VVSFGGSYGGTLTTFLRATYPDTVVGGLAASAPIGYYDPQGWEAHGVDAFTWSRIAAEDYDRNPGCTAAILKARAAIESTPVRELVESFHVCEATGLGPTNKAELFQYALEGTPQQDYPYSIGAMPAWPVQAFCAKLVAAAAAPAGEVAGRLVEAAASITGLVMGYDGKTCLPTLIEGPGGVPGDGPGLDSWGYQSCTETLHQFGSRSPIRRYEFSFEAQESYCLRIFNHTVQPDTSALTRRFGGYKLGDGLTAASNIIWSNGGLDPWHGGGFLTPHAGANHSNHWIFMERGAHHLDLRAPHPADPPEVTAARAKEEDIIRGWIDDASRE